MALLTPQEVADLLKVTRRQVYKLIEQGHLDGVRIGDRTVRVRSESVEQLITKQAS